MTHHGSYHPSTLAAENESIIVDRRMIVRSAVFFVSADDLEITSSTDYYIVSHTADLQQAKPPSLHHLQELAVSRAINTNGSSHKASHFGL